MKPTLLVLAAGMGSRYGGLKQIDPMGPSGETILDYSVFDAIRAGFGKVVFIIRPDFEQDFRERIAAKFASKIEVGFAFQTLHNLCFRRLLLTFLFRCISWINPELFRVFKACILCKFS